MLSLLSGLARWFIFLVMLLQCHQVVLSQSYTNRLKKISVRTDTTCILVRDSLSIVPSTLEIYSDTLLPKDWFYITNLSVSVRPEYCSLIQGKTLKIQYRVFPYNLEKTYFGLDTILLRERDVAIQGAYQPYIVGKNTSFIESDGLQYRGSFGRGISIGNNQSFVLNSNFDLQLEGDIGNGIKVLAAISDENLPIQAQGNTQQLQEFDKVFIQLSKGRSNLIAGDFELRNASGYYMQYYKKLKGISAHSYFPAGKNVEGRARGGFAVSRGKFARQNLQSQEGNQGPYKLVGNNNERFIIVLSGTEKVYFNGILLKRGFDLDYVIDYNRAEITFSPTRVIARDSRIIIEFEYTDVNYVRTLYEMNTSFRGRNWEWGLNMYSEQDNKSQTGNVLLDTTDIRILEESGDDLSKMIRSSVRLIDTTLENQDVILYKLGVDPMEPGRSILVFSTNLDSAKYTAVFTEVGAGNGDYEIDEQANVNGRVYKYIGKNMGKYAPIVKLIPPEQKQLFTSGGYYQVNKNIKIQGEGALSHYDINTLSSIGNDNNSGLAGNIGVEYKTRLDTSDQWSLLSLVSLEHIDAAFQPLNPFRNAEFARDWNLGTNPVRAEENLVTGSLQLLKKNVFGFQYGLKYFNRSGVYEGARQTGKMDWTLSWFTLAAQASYLTSTNKLQNQDTRFFRPNIKTSIFLDNTKNWTLTGELDAEQNIITNKLEGGSLKGSAAYQHYKLSLGNNPEKNLSFRAGVNRRLDQLPEVDSLVQAARADEWEITGKWNAPNGNMVLLNLTHRDLQVLEPDILTTARSTKSLIGKFENQLIFWKKAIKTHWVYAVSSGQEPKIEYKFVKLETGRGDFVYVGQDEIPNLSLLQDFRYNPSDPLANYIRVSLYNNEFIRTNNIELNQSLRADFDKIFVPSSNQKKSKKRWNTFLAKFSILSNARIQKRVLENSGGNALTYINFSRQDSNLVAYTGLWNHTLFFNKGNIAFDLQMGQRKNDTRVVQVNGYEDRGKEDIFIRSRIRISEQMDLILNGEKGISTYGSKVFSTRDFRIDFINVFPEINWRPNLQSRFVGMYTYTRRQQTILGMENALQHKMTLEFNWRQTSLFNIDAQVNFIKINYTGPENSTIEYDLLEGLKNGNNFVWSCQFTRRLAKSIDLTLQYEGRKPGTNPVIHVGQAQVKATF